MDASPSDQKRRGKWEFTARGVLLLAVSVALGVTLGAIGLGERLPEYWPPPGSFERALLAAGRDWYIAALAAISFWIVLGLSAQARDIGRKLRSVGPCPSEVRWGLRFAMVCAGWFAR